MELSQNWIDHNLVISVPENHLSINIGQSLKQLISELSTHESGNIIFDLSQVKKIDSSGMAGLVYLYKWLQGRGELRLCGINDSIRQMMEITRIDQLIHQYRTVDEALSDLSPH